MIPFVRINGCYVPTLLAGMLRPHRPYRKATVVLTGQDSDLVPDSLNHLSVLCRTHICVRRSLQQLLSGGCDLEVVIVQQRHISSFVASHHAPRSIAKLHDMGVVVCLVDENAHKAALRDLRASDCLDSFSFLLILLSFYTGQEQKGI